MPRLSVAVTIKPSPPSGLWAELALPSGTIRFAQSVATNVGAYTGPFVTQRRWAQRQGPWQVFFCQDADGSRDEVIVEYGIWPVPAGITPGHIQAPFQVRIGKDSVTLATVTVPAQYWFTRWRWPSTPRPIKRSFAGLKAMRAILPPDARCLYGTEPAFSLPKAVWTGPMGSAGLQTALGAGGGRPEIGPITEPQAEWLMHGTPAALTAMMAQAEAIGSLPIWLRDARTGNLLDVYANPSIGVLSDAGPLHQPVYPAYPKDISGKVPADFFQIDTSHYIPIAFVPWLLTDDPYYLEGAEAGAISCATQSNGQAINYKLPGLCVQTTPRSVAWSVREIARMSDAAPETAPPWLQPRSYFKKMLNDNLTYVKYQMSSALKCEKIFHIPSDNNGLWPCFHLDYLATTLGWMKWSGRFPEWDDAVVWYAQTILRALDPPGTGGFDRRWPVPYYVMVNNARVDSLMTPLGGPAQPLYRADENVMLPGYQTAANRANVKKVEDNTPDSYAEAWTLFQSWMAVRGFPFTLGSEDKIYQNQIDNPQVIQGDPTPSNPGYCEERQAGLAAYAMAGVEGARERWQWLRDHMPPVYASYGYHAPRWVDGRQFAYWPDP